MGGAGDARVVVPDRLLDLPLEGLRRDIQPRLHEGPEVLLDRRQVLGGGRDDPGLLDLPVGADPVAVVEDSTRGLGTAAPGSGGRRHRDEGGLGDLVGAEELQRLVDRPESLDRPDDDAPERVPADRPQAGAPRQLPDRGRKAVEVEAVPGQRTDEVAATPFQPRVEGVRVGDLLLGEARLVVGGLDVEPAARDDPSLRERVVGRVAEGDELVIHGEVGEGEAGHQIEELPRDRPPLLEPGSGRSRSPPPAR